MDVPLHGVDGQQYTVGIQIYRMPEESKLIY